jgi:iron(III) transport system substrate-binding protein
VTSNLAEAGAPVTFRYPKKDLVSIYSPLGLVAHCANEQNGKLLYDYILSKEGQEILVKNNLISIRDDVKQADRGMDAISQRTIQTDLDWIAENSDEIMSRFDKIFLS